MKRRVGLVAAIAVTGVALAGCGLQPAGDGDASGGVTTLTIYSPRPDNIADHVISAFEDANPQYKVNLLTLGAAEVADRVRAEGANPQGDVWWGGTPTSFEAATAEGLLAPFDDAVLERVPAEFHGTDDAWVAEQQQLQLIAYNHDMIGEDEVPADWSDLADPAYRDQIIIRDVAPSGTMRSVFAAIIDQTYETDGTPDRGYEFLRALDANTKDYAANPSDLYLRMQRQEAAITIWNHQDILAQTAAGAPFSIHVPTSGAAINRDGIAKIAGGPSPEAADAFAEFVFSDETQSWLAENAFQIPTVELPSEPDWLADLEFTELPVNSETTAAHEAEWIDYWLTNIKGQG